MILGNKLVVILMEKLHMIFQVHLSVFLLMVLLLLLELQIMMAMELIAAMYASIKILEGFGLK